MRKLSALLLSVLMVLSIFTGCSSSNKTETTGNNNDTQAAADNTAESDWAYIEGKGKMVIGITLFAPMNYYKDTDSEELIGFDTELTTAVCEKDRKSVV